MGTKSILIICETLYPEISEKIPPHISKVEVIEYRYHLYPEKLNAKLISVVKDLDKQNSWDQILLGFGLCSNAVIGIKSLKSRIVVPKADDCIALFLGSIEAYRAELSKEPGTYYLTKGWIECGGDGLAVLNRQHEWTRHLDEKTAEWFAHEMCKNYTRLALIETGGYDVNNYIDHANKVANTFKLRFEIMQGTLDYLIKLVNGPWDQSFVVVEPGYEITKEMFNNMTKP